MSTKRLLIKIPACQIYDALYSICDANIACLIKMPHMRKWSKLRRSFWLFANLKKSGRMDILKFQLRIREQERDTVKVFIKIASPTAKITIDRKSKM